MGIKRVIALHHGGDDDGQSEHDEHVEGDERPVDGAVPPEVVVGAQNPLRPDEVDDEDEDDAGGDEDLGGEREADVGGEGDGRDADGAGGDAGHAEAWWG